MQLLISRYKNLLKDADLSDLKAVGIQLSTGLQNFQVTKRDTQQITIILRNIAFSKF
jgi:hypothetical protein